MAETATKRGTAWSSAEEEQLRTEFTNGMTIGEMIRTHGRNAGGLMARLEKLGLIESRLVMSDQLRGDYVALKEPVVKAVMPVKTSNDGCAVINFETALYDTPVKKKRSRTKSTDMFLRTILRDLNDAQTMNDVTGVKTRLINYLADDS